MSTNTITIMQPRIMDFTDAINTTSTAIQLKRKIDVGNWTRAAMLVRVTALPALTGAPMDAGNIVVKVQYDGFTEEDPGALSEADVPGASVTIDSTVVPPSLLIVDCGNNLGRMLKVVAVGTRTNGVTNNIAAMFSVDLKLISAGATLL